MSVLLNKKYPLPVADLANEIHRRLERNATGSFIYIIPTKRKVRDVQREFLKHVPGGIAPSFHVFTLETLAAAVYSFLCPAKRFVAGPAQAVLVNEAITAVRDSLRYFRFRGFAHRLPKGTFQKIIDVINVLKEKGCYLSVLRAEVGSAESNEQAKLADILAIYEEYERRLGEAYIDAAGILQQVNLCWDEHRSPELFRKRFPSVDALFIAGFDEFSDPELTLLYHLSNISGIGTLISFDYHPKNDEIFGHLKENYRKFFEMGFTKLDSKPLPHPTFTEHIALNLFNRGLAATKFPASSSVTILETNDRQKEVECIAKLVKLLVREKPDRDLSKICIAMFRPQVYTHLFRETFARYGIPANVTDRYALDQSPLVVSLLSLLAVRQNNFRLNDIMRALSSPYVRIMRGSVRIDSGNLYEVATKLKVTVGYTTWMDRIEQRLALITQEISLASGDEIEEARLRREQAMLQNARADLECLAKLLDRFNQPMTPIQFKQHVVDLLEETHTLECLLRVPLSLIGDEQLEKDARAYQQFLHFLDEFLGILALEQHDNKVREPLSFYLERLRTALTQVRYNIRQRYGYGVQVTSFDETRGIQFDVMIVAGLIDGEFPAVYQPEIFFSSNRRAQQERYHLTEHRYLFYQAITNFTEHLYLTYPSCDGDAHLVSSSFLDAFFAVVDAEDRRHDPPKELAEGIFSEDELLQHVGASMRHREDLATPINLSLYPTLSEELNATLDHMRHAITVERSRMTQSSLPEYNGTIAESLGEEARGVLERFRDRVYSVTQLESYGSCPFQFFAEKVLRLNVTPQVEEGMTPFERGGVLHEILFEFYTERRNHSRPPIPECDEKQFDTALDDLLSLARRKLDQLHGRDIFWDVDQELILGSPNRKGVLEEFLETERKHTLEVRPAFFEVAFGSKVGAKTKTDSTLTSEEPVVAGNVQLRGKIDRIDTADAMFRIIDYKTGSRVATRREIDNGMSLQLPIYLYAVERILAECRGEKKEGVAGIFYKLRPPVEQKLGVGSETYRDKAFSVQKKSKSTVVSDEELHTVIAQAIAFVNNYVDGIARGEFPVEPKNPAKVCTYCDFKTMCRIQSQVTVQTDNESAERGEMTS
jgi:ATP-dependent helicase/nuclease subunit B